MEPIAGSAGVLIPPVGYLNRIREICDKHGILMILDEVITGFGRTGHSFGAEAFNVSPDLMTIAKGMTSGMVPMGGVLAWVYLFGASIGCCCWFGYFESL